MRSLAFIALLALFAASPAQPQSRGAREIAFIANAEGGTVSLLDVASRAVIGEIDINPAKAKAGPAGAPNFAQDTDVSPDGKVLYVSRGYLGDVAAFDIASGRLLWRTMVDPARADHMTLSADGRSLYVSAFTQNRTRRIDTKTGAVTGSVVTGVSPHDNQLSKDGRRLFNSSIGDLNAPIAARDTISAPTETSGYAYQLTIADAATLQVRDRIRMSNGLRPWRFSPDEKVIYGQVSNEHAVMAFDIAARKVVRRLELPIAKGVTAADYAFEAPHHGLALTDDGRTLCLAGRASDYAALVKAPELTLIATVPVGDAPGWAEVADRGRICLTANARSDDVSLIAIAERKEVARIRVGDGPKHITVAWAPAGVLAAVRARSRP